MSKPTSEIKNDLEKMRGLWQYEHNSIHSFRTTLWFQYLGGNSPSLSIQDSRFGGKDRPYPIFPFFEFEIQEKGTVRFIQPKLVVSSEPNIAPIPYHFDREFLVVESGIVTIRHGFGEDVVHLVGSYSLVQR